MQIVDGAGNESHKNVFCINFNDINMQRLKCSLILRNSADNLAKFYRKGTKIFLKFEKSPVSCRCRSIRKDFPDGSNIFLVRLQE